MVVKLYGWLGYLIAPLVVTWAVVTRLVIDRSEESTTHSIDLWIYSAWILPPLVFYTAIYFLKPTYLLILLPPIILLTIALASRSERWVNSRQPIIFGGVVALGLSLMYLGPDQRWPKPLYRHSYSFVADSDRAWAQLIRGIESCNAGPRSVLIWQDPLPLPVYAVRLLQWRGLAASISTGSQMRNYFKPDALSWFTPNPLDIPKNIANEVIISGSVFSLNVQCQSAP